MFNVLKNVLPSPYDYLETGAYICVAFQLVGTMTVLTLDRLVCIIKPLLYRDQVSASLVRNVLIGCWLLSITLAIVIGVFPIILMYMFLLLLFVLASYFLLTVVTFIIIFFRIRSSRKRFVTGTAVERSSWKFYIVSSLIVGTYFLFYLIPAIVTTMIGDSKSLTRWNCLLHEGLVIFAGVGFVSDAFIYIFLQEDFRKIGTWLVFSSHTGHKTSSAPFQRGR